MLVPLGILQLYGFNNVIVISWNNRRGSCVIRPARFVQITPE